MKLFLYTVLYLVFCELLNLLSFLRNITLICLFCLIAGSAWDISAFYIKRSLCACVSSVVSEVGGTNTKTLILLDSADHSIRILISENHFV